jgi:hypothetical protein
MEIKTIIAIVTIIIGIVFLVLGVREIYIDNSDKYQSTAAEIYDVRIETKYIDRERLNFGGLSVRETNTEYQLYNQYKYKVGDLDFTGEFKAGKVPTMVAAKNEKDRIIKEKNKITIYYLKSGPKQSGLTFDKNNSFLYFVLTTVCLIIGLVVYFGTFKNNDKKNKVVFRTYNFD